MLCSSIERQRAQESWEQLLQQLRRQRQQTDDLIAAVQQRLQDADEDLGLLNALMERAPVGIALADAPDGTIRLVSKHGLQMTGRSPEGLEGIPIEAWSARWWLLHLDGVTPARGEELPLARAIRQGQLVADEEWLLQRADGSKIRVLCSAAPLHDHNGKIIGGVAVWRDITDRQRAEEAKAQLAAIVESSGDAIYRHALDGTIESWNPGASLLFGYSAEEIKGQPVSVLVPPELSEELQGTHTRIERGERVAPYTTVRVRKDGSRVRVSICGSPIKDGSGRVIAIAKIAREVAQPGRTEAESRTREEQRALPADQLATRESRSADATHASGNGVPGSQAQGNPVLLDDILITEQLSLRPSRPRDLQAENDALRVLARQMVRNPHGMLETLVKMARRLCQAGTAGVSLLEAQADGESFFRWAALAGAWEGHEGGTTPRHFSACGTCLDRKASQLYSYPGRYFAYYNETQPIIVEALVIPLVVGDYPLGTIWILSHDEQRHFDGEDARIMSSIADFTAAALHLSSLSLENARLYQESRSLLRQREAYYQRIVENAFEGIWTIDAEGKTTFVNQRAAEMLGCMVAEMLGRLALDFVFPAELTGVTAKLEECVRGAAVICESRLSRKDGTTLWALLTACPIWGEQGERAGALLMFTDIGERKRAEERALQAERLAAIGQMIAGLAHESGNALQRSQACLRMLAQEVNDRPEATDLVNRIQSAQDDLRHLFEDLRTYAAPVNLDLHVFDLAECWREAWSQLEPQRQGRDVALREETDDLDLQCWVDSFRLVQVFRNVFDNALAACQDPVRIVIHCSLPSLGGQPAIQIAVRDNGPGIPGPNRAEVLEPFFTTKTSGTGLGLAIARRIVEAHGGKLAIGDTAGPGAEILIILPREVS